MGEPQEPRQVKVIDRRRFTSAGEARTDIDFPEPSPSPVEAVPAPSADPEPAAPEIGAPAAAVPSQILLDTVDFLAQVAVAFLSGQVPGVPRDAEAARLYIDLLAQVQERTRTSASLQEAKVLDDVLYQLRLQLVASTR
ncbi:MAG TPA: DUF1844 domain-containing protein [Thermoanaerobaculaceae bacterium]|nr:DUF1844 domain-containing protein [Thermoanaerobaculaceae bacterium]HPS79228.1 DUF1844 domain-containing protein [Thermoanaerobaculaceae bacterium]